MDDRHMAVLTEAHAITQHILKEYTGAYLPEVLATALLMASETAFAVLPEEFAARLEEDTMAYMYGPVEDEDDE